VSVGVCLAAAAQAELPKARRRFWSRPLIALLYLLQPIVRGWARYRGRLGLRPLPPTAQPTLDSIALRDSRQRLGETRYWLERRVERMEFLLAVLERLNREGWPHRADAGWSDHDVEIYGGRWARLQLTSVAEDHPKNRQKIRCRLRPRWSLQARVAFWSLLGLELLVIGVFGRTFPWLWLLLLTLPVFVWFLAREKRNLQSLVAVWLDGVAQPLGMLKVTPPVAEKKSVGVRLE